MMSRPPNVSIAAPTKRSAKPASDNAAVDRDGLAAGGLDFGGNGVARRGIEIVDHDLCALAGELQRNGAADAAARSGDQRDFSLELGHAIFLD